MLAKPCVLVVEDEPAQRDVLAYNIEAQGYSVLTAASGNEALLIVAEQSPDLVVLDWMIPEGSGIEVCRQIKTAKKTREIPVIMLSARTEAADRVRGLETGADDYVVKPYALAELLARIRLQLRRTHPASLGDLVRFEDIVLDAARHRVHRSENEITLGPTEFRLLATFMQRPGRVWSRAQLLDQVWGCDVYIGTRTVDVHVGRLRKALCARGERNPLRTVRGEGYALG